MRLFKAAFNITLAYYIRSRRLAASLEKLFNTEFGIADIAVEYGFDHAQSYIRAFKREFGLTPGEARKNRKAVNVKPPLHLFPGNEFADGLVFGPEIVYFPTLYCVGRRHIIPRHNVELPAKAARDFWINDKKMIPNVTDTDVYIGLTKHSDEPVDYTYYIPSVCVRDFCDIPRGFESNVIHSGIYARFHYIGEHHYMDININVARGMYNALEAFDADKEARYGLFGGGISFERIAESDYDGMFCKMEWYTPVYEK
jgi:AraC family transcriptional regulator